MSVESFPAIAFRLAAPEEWAAAMAAGAFTGSEHDVRDGFIHLSAAGQVAGTLTKYYADQERLVLAEIDLDALGETVKWEKSRGGADFPHIYGDIPSAAVKSVRLLARNEAGEWMLPHEALGDQA
jgi:uncharacterized protein (DUF952 family)